MLDSLLESLKGSLKMRRHSRFIQTGRAELYVDVTTLPRPGEGFIELTGGVSGSINSVTVDGIIVTRGIVPFRESLALTAEDLADNINNNISAPNYHARAIGAKVFIWQQTITDETLVIVADTTTITTDVENLAGGVLGNGTPLGYVEEGFDLLHNVEFLKETAEQSGVTAIKKFYIGENVQVQTVLKQWDSDSLAVKFPGQHSITGNANRVELPGNLVAGDDMGSYDKVLLLVPDNKSHPALLIRKGSNGGEGATPIRFRTQETKKLALLIDCLPDEAHTETDYKTLGCDLLQNLEL
jgi:hypothetical protein